VTSTTLRYGDDDEKASNPKDLAEQLTCECSMTHRRPATGIAVRANDILRARELFRTLDFAKEGGAFENTGGKLAQLLETDRGRTFCEALEVANAAGHSEGVVERKLRKALGTVADFLKEHKDVLHEQLTQQRARASREYVFSSGMLELLTAFTYRRHWAQTVPDNDTDSPALAAWKGDPGNKEKMIDYCVAAYKDKEADSAARKAQGQGNAATFWQEKKRRWERKRGRRGGRTEKETQEVRRRNRE